MSTLTLGEVQLWYHARFTHRGGFIAMLHNLFRWQKGRQQSGYEKMLLAGATWPIKFDLYLLRFPEGCEVPPHTDKVDSGQHYRLNIVLKQAKSGGEFICQTPIYCSKRIKLFRPDRCEHAVTRVNSGNRYLLSIGWVRDWNDTPL